MSTLNLFVNFRTNSLFWINTDHSDHGNKLSETGFPANSS